MGRLHKNVRKYSLGQKAGDAIIGKDNMDAIHVLGSQAEASYDAKKASEKALKDAEHEPVIPLPDEEQIERVRRRRNARRGGGRASTVLSDSAGYGG
jgi:c-di-GMP-binding flagellar brake protein YcgR